MTLIETSIKCPSLIIVLFWVLMLGGLYCYSLLSYELMPDFSLPTLTTKTPSPGPRPPMWSRA
jgi:HAE1 family hydrophobic/amphiphilic exporter-1